MAEEPKQLGKNDEVYIKSLGLYGKVLAFRGIDEREEDQFYTVQIIRYCSRADLELIDREAEREKREADIQRKTDRMTRAHDQIEAGDKTTETALEFLHACNDLWQALGHEPILRKK